MKRLAVLLLGALVAINATPTNLPEDLFNELRLLKNKSHVIVLNNVDIKETESKDNVVLIYGDLTVNGKKFEINDKDETPEKPNLCNAQSYRFNSALFVNLTEPVTEKCSEGIVALIDSGIGKVFVAGIEQSPDLDAKLKAAGLIATTLSVGDVNKLYYTVSEFQDDLYRRIVTGDVEDAVELSVSLRSNQGYLLSEVITKAAAVSPRNVQAFGYNLKQTDADLPVYFEHLLNGYNVTIANKQFPQRLSLSIVTDRTPKLVTQQKALITNSSSARDVWQLIATPYSVNDNIVEVHFRLKNIQLGTCLGLDTTRFKNLKGDRSAIGLEDCESDLTEWFLEPVILEDDVGYYIVNRRLGKALKVPEGISYEDGDRLAYGHDFTDEEFSCNNSERCQWLIKVK